MALAHPPPLQTAVSGDDSVQQDPNSSSQSLSNISTRQTPDQPIEPSNGDPITTNTANQSTSSQNRPTTTPLPRVFGMKWSWSRMATSIGLVLMFFYSEYGRRSQQDANRLAKENNGFAKASIEFSQWDYCVSKDIEDSPVCQEIDHHIAQSLNPTLVLGRRSLPQHGNLSVEVFTTRRNHRQETSQVELTSLLCSLSLEMSPNTPYRGLVILASFLSLKGKSALNVTPPQGEHTARSSALLTETLLMALPSYTINAVYYEGRPRANAYSAAFYNPIVFGFLLPAAFGTDVTGLPHGVLARLLWLFSEWAMLLPISYFLMFDFLPLLEHIHRVSLIPHSSLRWRYSFLSEISYMFKQKRSSHDRAVFCLNIATGFFVLYGAWSSTLSFFAFFFFMFWEPRLLRRKCGWWALQVLSLVSVLTYFVTKL